MYTCNKDRLERMIQKFSLIGATGNGGITRLSLTAEDIEARDEFCKICDQLGMEIKTDDIANIYATLPGEEDLPAIVTGSHLDSVIQGGNYDGVLGVLSALEVVQTIVEQQIPHRHPITIVVWTNEEGIRFEPAMMSSGVITEQFKKEKILSIKDKNGITFEDALDTSKYKGSIDNRLQPMKSHFALIELHIEQGPVLEQERKDIGIVEGVVGMVNYVITITGESNHAGTTPMRERKDALLTATELIWDLNNRLKQLDDELLYTIGRMTVEPNIHTVIPNSVSFSLDVRHVDMQILNQVVLAIQSLPKEYKNCQIDSKEQWSRKTVMFDQTLLSYIEESAVQLGYSNMRMYSGAGHDAQYLSKVLPTAMIFVPSQNGHSHQAKEYTTSEQCLQGANVLLQSIIRIDTEQ